MTAAGRVQLKPRKRPVQARSEASVQAILEATLQVLLRDGRARLTTTRVADRAGVSVGTLYQYFPNKSSLLQALLRAHLDEVATEVERACSAAHGSSTERMGDELTTAFVRAKFRRAHASVALYSISDDVDGSEIARQMHARASSAIAEMLRTSAGRIRDPEMVADTLLSAMAGVSRAMLERGAAAEIISAMERELRVLVRVYLAAATPE